MRSVTIVAAAVMALAIPAVAEPFPAPPPDPHFYEVSEGLVSPKFHPRRGGNRVFYAASVKAAQPWLRFTDAHVSASLFSHYALLGIFYQRSPGAIPHVTSIRVSPPVGNAGPPGMQSTLVVGVTLYPICWYAPGTAPPPCVISIWSPNVSSCAPGATRCSAWEPYLLEAIDKSLVPTRIDRVVVTEAVYVPPPPQCSANGCIPPFPPLPFPQ
jgi:hypothetical protein